MTLSLTLFADANAGDVHWAWTVVGLVAIPLLVALNGYFVAAEFSLVAVRKTRITELLNQGVPRAKAAASAVEHLDRSIAATQLGITLASIALGMVSEPALARVFEPLFTSLPAPFNVLAKHSAASILAFALITYMHVVFGELMPKSIALQAPEKTSLLVSGPLNVFARLTRPLILIMNGTGNWLLRRLGFRAARAEESVHSVEELMILLEDTEEAGMIEADQAEIVVNVFRLSDKKVRDCMIPRQRMDALELTTSEEMILEAVRKAAHTRMPVYEGNIDKIVGVVNTKDLFYLYSLRGAVVLDDALYPATFLDPEESIATALQLFRKSRKPMAIVRDAEGKVHGLITLEDVIEEIVGDIEDEHDRPMRKLVRRRRRRA